MIEKLPLGSLVSIISSAHSHLMFPLGTQHKQCFYITYLHICTYVQEDLGIASRILSGKISLPECHVGFHCAHITTHLSQLWLSLADWQPVPPITAT